MSKVYIYSSNRGKSIILEATSTDAAKSAYQEIKAHLPGISVGVYGAKDLNTFRRAQRTISNTKVTKSVSDFVKNLNTLTHA